MKSKGYIFWSVLSSASFSWMAIVTKSLKEIEPLSLVFIRSMVGFFVLFPFAKKKEQLKLEPTFLKKILLRTGFGIVGIAFFFKAIQMLPAAIATLLNQVSPVFVAALSYVLWRERLHLFQYAGIFFVLVGLVVVSQAFGLELSRDYLYGIGIGLLGSLFSAFAFISLKHATTSIGPYTVVTWFCFFSAAILSFFINWETLNFGDNVLSFFALGVFGAFGQLSLTKAYSMGKVTEVSVLTVSLVPISGLMDYCFFGQVITGMQMVGIFLVLTGTGFVLTSKP